MANDHHHQQQRGHGIGIDGVSIDWSFAASQAYLPPRSPIFSSSASSNNLNLIPDQSNNNNHTNNHNNGNSFFSNWPKPQAQYNESPSNGGVSSSRMNRNHHHHHHHHHHHQRTPSTSFLPVHTPAWVDDLLNDSPDVPPPNSGRISHRRSSSDSFAFMDHSNPSISDIMSSPSSSNNHNHSNNLIMSSPSSSNVMPQNAAPKQFGNGPRDMVDDWPDVLPRHPSCNSSSSSGIHYSKPFAKSINNNGSTGNGNAAAAAAAAHMPMPERIHTPPLGSSSAPSDHDSANASSMDEMKIGGPRQPKIETEVQSALKAEPTTMSLPATKGDINPMNDSVLDPKRAKRILANRQSAQRSRVRKLQYISELERTVNILQEEVSALSPQVTYLDRHRIILNVDNSAMKQRLAALAQEKLFKDAHNEALKNEVHRLRQLYQQQQQQQQKQPQQKQNLGSGDGNQQPHSNLVPSTQHDMKEPSDMGLDATKCVEYMLKDSDGEPMKDNMIVPPRSPPPMKPIGPSSRNLTVDKAKGLMNSQVMHTQLCPDFRVQNT